MNFKQSRKGEDVYNTLRSDFIKYIRWRGFANQEKSKVVQVKFYRKASEDMRGSKKQYKVVGL